MGEIMLKMNEYLKAKQACEFLGVSRSTLKNMDRDGILVAHRAPSSKYRLYTQDQLEKFLKRVQDANEFMGMK
jgi:excisionase family DNA binding protein